MEDIFGLKVWGETAKLVVGTGLDGAKKFFNSLTGPALSELGYKFKDRITERRLKNIIDVINKNPGQFTFENGELKINPKLLGNIIESASNEDNDDMQNLWAGLLLASSNDINDENSIFVDLLKKVSPLMAKIINHGCSLSQKVLLEDDSLSIGPVYVERDNLFEIFGNNDFDRVWREIEYLVSIGLQFVPITFDGGLSKNQDKITINPSDLAIELYIRCKGSTLTAKEFFKNEIISEKNFILQSMPRQIN